MHIPQAGITRLTFAHHSCIFTVSTVVSVQSCMGAVNYSVLTTNTSDIIKENVTGSRSKLSLRLSTDSCMNKEKEHTVAFVSHAYEWLDN